jgi:fucose permease
VERNLTLTPLVIAATYLGMLSVGALNASYGAALEVLGVTLSVATAQLGLLGAAQTVGGVLGNLATAALPRWTTGQRMALGGALFAVGAVWFGLETRFAAALAALFVVGLGMGLVQVGFSGLYARGFGARSGAVMGAMSTAFAVGSIAGPALAAALGAQYRLLPLVFGALMLGLSALFARARDLEALTHEARDTRLGAREGLFAVMVVLYVAAEQSASFWGVTHLERVGVDRQRAALTISAFWTMLLVGRFVAAGLALRVPSRTLLTASASGATLCFGLAHVPALAVWMYPLAGLCLAPVFPGGLVWMARHTASPHATTLYLVAGSLGATLGVPAIGWVSSASPLVIPTALSALTLLCALVIVVLGVQQPRDTVNGASALNSGA